MEEANLSACEEEKEPKTILCSIITKKNLTYEEGENIIYECKECDIVAKFVYSGNQYTNRGKLIITNKNWYWISSNPSKRSFKWSYGAIAVQGICNDPSLGEHVILISFVEEGEESLNTVEMVQGEERKELNGEVGLMPIRLFLILNTHLQLTEIYDHMTEWIGAGEMMDQRSSSEEENPNINEDAFNTIQLIEPEWWAEHIAEEQKKYEDSN